MYEVHTISFQTFIVWAFKIVVDSWKFSMLLLYILWDDWPIFMISGSNEQLQKELEYTPTGISTRTMHQSTTPTLSQIIWPRWVSRPFFTLPVVQTLLPKLRGYRYETIEMMKQALTKVFDTLTHEDFHRVFQKFLERYNKCIVAGGYYFEGDKSFMCVLSIKLPIRKKCGNLS